jgi:hypothetical protein
MAALSLEYRAKEIREHFQLKSFSSMSVIKLYKKHKISYRKPQYSYYRKLANKDQVFQQQKISKEMGELIVKGRHLINVDESTFNLWQTPSRAWVRGETVRTLASSTVEVNHSHRSHQLLSQRDFCMKSYEYFDW